MRYTNNEVNTSSRMSSYCLREYHESMKTESHYEVCKSHLACYKQNKLLGFLIRAKKLIS